MSDGQTKRQLLSSISKLFDPLGLASPIVVKAKLMMQSTWQLNFNSDEDLLVELQKTRLFGGFDKLLRGENTKTDL